jgi:hypothetical protein
MERDTKIQGGVAKIDAKLKELEDKKKALPKQEIPSLSVMHKNFDLARKYIEMDDLEKKYATVKTELGMTEPELEIDGYKISEWKTGIKTQIALNNINAERRSLQEKKAELEKHYTEDHAVDEILKTL